MGTIFDEDDDGPGLLFSSTPQTNAAGNETLELPDVFSDHTTQQQIQTQSKKASQQIDFSTANKSAKKNQQSAQKSKEPTQLILNPSEVKQIKRTQLKNTKNEVEMAIIEAKADIIKKFDEIEKIIASLHANSQLGRHTYLSNQEIIDQTRYIVTESDAKDRKLKEFQEQINELYDVFDERKNLEKLRKQISDKEKELKSESEETCKYQSACSLETCVSNLENQLKTIQDSKLSEESNLRFLYERDTNTMSSKIIADIEKLKTAQTQADTNKINYNSKIKSINEENEKLKQKVTPEVEEELAKLKHSTSQKISSVVKALASGTLEFIEDGIEEKRKYKGSICVQAIKTALSTVSDEIINPDDEYDD